MKELELRRHSTCDLCDKPIGHTGLPLFWRLKVDRWGIDLAAARRQDGLAQFIGSTAIARVMGPDEDMAKPMMPPVTLTACETCAVEHLGRVMVALEHHTEAHNDEGASQHG
jgi:hypothetical protein